MQQRVVDMMIERKKNAPDDEVYDFAIYKECKDDCNYFMSVHVLPTCKKVHMMVLAKLFM